MGMNHKDIIKGIVNDGNSILAKHIDRYLAKGKFPEQWNLVIDNYKEDDNYFHPSSDCLPSSQELYLAKTGQAQREKIGASLRKAFQYGSILHSYYDEILIDMGLVERENVELVHQHEIETEFGTCIGKGTVDLLNVSVPNHGEWLVDLKTMSGNDIPPTLMEKYVAQVLVYGDWFQTDKIMILGIGKTSPHTLREYIIQPNPYLIHKIYNKWGYVQRCIDDGISIE